MERALKYFTDALAIVENMPEVDEDKKREKKSLKIMVLESIKSVYKNMNNELKFMEIKKQIDEIDDSSNSNDIVTSSNTKVIQMKKMPGGTYEIPCKVNGLDLKFIFDTGASSVSLSLTEALFMLKNGYLKEIDILGTQKYSIANGEIAEGTTIRIKKLEFGGVTLYDVDASIMHELKAPLLLGQSAISRLGKIQIDPQNSTLTIVE